MEEKILQVLIEIKKELQDIRSILEPKEIDVMFNPEDSNGIHVVTGNNGKCKFN